MKPEDQLVFNIWRDKVIEAVATQSEKTMKQIAGEFGISLSYLYAITKVAGISRRTTAGMKRWVTAGQPAQAAVALAKCPRCQFDFAADGSGSHLCAGCKRG